MSLRHNSEGLIEKYYEAFNNKDMDTFFSLLHEQVIHDINQGEREIGIKSFKKFMDEINKYYNESIENIVILSNESGSRVSAEYFVKGKYLSTAPSLPSAKGQTYALPGGAFFEIQGNKITRVTNYYNLPNWLAQVK